MPSINAKCAGVQTRPTRKQNQPPHELERQGLATHVPSLAIHQCLETAVRLDVNIC